MSFKNRMQKRGSEFKWHQLKSKNYIVWTTKKYRIHVKKEISRPAERQWASQERLSSIKSAIDGNNFEDISKTFNTVLIICTFANLISMPFYRVSWFSTSWIKKNCEIFYALHTWYGRKSCRILSTNFSVI